MNHHLRLQIGGLVVCVGGLLASPRTADATDAEYCALIELEDDFWCGVYTPPNYISCGRCHYENILGEFEDYYRHCDVNTETWPEECHYVPDTESCGPYWDYCETGVPDCEGLESCIDR